jgi:hypothetical protein
VIIIEHLLEKKSRGSGLENLDCGRRGSAAMTTGHPFINKETEKMFLGFDSKKHFLGL